MVDSDSLRLCFGLFLLIPLCYLFRFISSPRLRYLYSLLSGLLLQYFVYGAYLLPIYLQHGIVFLLLKFHPRTSGALVTLQSMLFLSGYHIYEYYSNYGGWRMNAVGLLMILVCKYSLLAYNLQDGGKGVDPQGLTEEQRRNRITREIGFLEFMGYVSFLPTALIGPPLEFNDYQNFIDSQEVYTHIPPVMGVTLKTLGEALLCGVLHLLGDVFLPLSPLKTDPFYSQPLWFIILYSTATVYLIRCKYYFGWKLSMTAVHASGVSFNGRDFSRINSVSPWMVQTSIHVRDKINNWNISVQEWLRKAIYQRSPFKGKTANQLYVFVVSAFWHGIYSAYYISEVLWFVQLYLQALMFKYFNKNTTVVNKLYEKSGVIGHVLLAMVVSYVFTHSATYFLILQGEYCWKFMTRMYFIPEGGMLLLIAIFTLLPRKKEKKSEGKEKEKERLTAKVE